MSDRPDAESYETLINNLLDVQQRASASNIDALTASFEALGAVLTFLNKDSRIFDSEATSQLSRLMIAVHDRAQGAKPKLFFDPPDRKGAKGAPSYTSAIILRALVTAAFVTLCEVGMSKEEASRWLAAELKRSGINQPNGHAPGARAIARWRAELGGKSLKGSDQVFGMFVHGAQRAMLEAGQQQLHIDAPLDRLGAQAISKLLIKLLRIAGF
jgi:hypothetical protein